MIRSTFKLRTIGFIPLSAENIKSSDIKINKSKESKLFHREDGQSDV